MSGNKPRVSIGMPVYNGEAFLEESIESILAQTYGDFELIISDNGSTDGTEAICRSYADRDARIRYYRREQNFGAVPNFNLVFTLSSGEYFKWAAHDDICDPTFVQRCVEVLDSHPEVVWCHSRSSHIDSQGQPLSQSAARDVSYVNDNGPSNDQSKPPTRASERVGTRLRAVMLGDGGCIDAYGLIRSEIIRKTPGFLPYYGSEKAFIAELALWGPYHEIPETLFFVRVHPDAAGNLRTADQQQQFISATKKRRFESTRLKLLWGYTSAVLRANLTIAQRIHCFAIIARYLLQAGKWKMVLTKALRGDGLGDDHDLRRLTQE
jgi:glycosyltransferase involved in cell wall biosynthesis